MAEADMHQSALQMIMSHSDISITLKYYIGVTDTMLENARNIMSQNIDVKIDVKNRNSEEMTVNKKSPVTLTSQGLHAWCPEQESNQRHTDFQSVALPNELPCLVYGGPDGNRIRDLLRKRAAC